MSKKKRNKPQLMVLPNGERYQLCVLRVVSRDGDGRPLELEYVHPEKTVDLTEGGEDTVFEFSTCYMPERVCMTNYERDEDGEG